MVRARNCRRVKLALHTHGAMSKGTGVAEESWGDVCDATAVV